MLNPDPQRLRSTWVEFLSSATRPAAPCKGLFAGESRWCLQSCIPVGIVPGEGSFNFCPLFTMTTCPAWLSSLVFFVAALARVGLQGSSKVISVYYRDLALVLSCNKFNSPLSALRFLTVGPPAWICLPKAC